MWPTLARNAYHKVRNEDTSNLSTPQFFHQHDPIKIFKCAGMWNTKFPTNIRYKKQMATLDYTYGLVSIHNTISIVCKNDNVVDLTVDGQWMDFCPLVYKVQVENKPESIPINIKIVDVDGIDSCIDINQYGFIDANYTHSILVDALMNKPLEYVFRRFYPKPYIPVSWCPMLIVNCPWFECGKTYTFNIRAYNCVRLESCDLAFP